MAAASIPSTSGIQQTPINNKEEENVRTSTVEELLIQIENHLYKNSTHRASLLIAVWSSIGGRAGCFRNIEKVFHMLYRESALMVFGGHWATINVHYKRSLARALIQYSHIMGKYVEGSEGLCSALVMAIYDPWGDPTIRRLLNKEDVEFDLLKEFISSEPHELLLLRIECLVNAHFEEAAIRLLRCSLHSVSAFSLDNEEYGNEKDWKWPYMEWLLRLLFRKRRLNDIILETSSCSCHDGVRLIYRSFQSSMEDSEALTGTLINLFLVRDLLFKSSYCCTSELMKLWCEFQAKKQKSASDIQEAARKLLIGHASSSAQFYLFVDILWAKFGVSLLPLYLEMYIRGLTSDLNFLEAARQDDNKECVIEIENHMAAMYFKLFTLFNAINKEIALECLMSAFSLDPTKERLEWIKKLSLQISKEKAIKAATTNDDSKHKLCNKSGCSRNCIHPSAIKRKQVVMCDQAIQVGDDSFMDFENPVRISTDKPVTNSQESYDNPKPQFSTSSSDKVADSLKIVESTSNSDKVADSLKIVESISSSDKVASNSLEIVISTNSRDKVTDSLETAEKENELQPPNFSDEISLNKVQINGTSVKSVDNDLAIIEDVKCLCKSPKKESGCKDRVCNQDISKEANVDNSRVINEQAINLKKDNSILDETKSTSSSGFNNDNSSVVNSEAINYSTEKIVINNNVDKILNLSSAVNHEVANDEVNSVLDKSAIDIQGNSKEKCSNDTPINCIVDAQKEVLNLSTVIKDSETIDNCHDHTKETDIHMNGFMETEIDDGKNPTDTSKSQKLECEITVHSSEKAGPSLSAPDVFTNCTDNKTTILSEKQKENHQDTAQLDMTSNCVPQISKIIVDTNSNVNENEPIMTRRSHFLKNGHSVAFSHIVLDSKLPGISSDITSDFVIVLESLRNRQLKSSCKWSQIKHLCENYLDIVSSLRGKMLKTHANESVDSEADSISELTANGFKDFEFHQSNDSIIEDHYADKSHVLRRFMNSDNPGGVGTYINLSDIHCPQIPLDKLFYTDRSSSRVGHKKKHKKHRNHEKNTGKLVLKKIRHGSRAQRELIKRKKKKKRKAKRTKGHTKKHRFTHGKVTKEYVKTKKKKHKLKKKKEGNSGFISGDYCSDFSSAELMRLVKEHSHSYTKFPASTSKHPHTSAILVGSASSSEASDEPQRKKRKVSFSKKRGRNDKCRDKHKHNKSKSGKRKKTVVMESCKTNLKNIMENNEIGRNVDSVNDYSRIVQFSSVKKMEAVQIRQRSVALNLSKVNKTENKTPSVNPCQAKPQSFSSNANPLEQFVNQNFDNYSPEDIMKMQLLMARQQPDVSAITTTVSTTNSQAVLKYVCSKTTSRLLSVAQTTNCTLGSDSETSKSPVPTFSARTSTGQKITSVLHQPQNLSTNVKHFLIESNNKPYKISGNTAVSCGSLVPASLAGSNFTDVHNLTGTVVSSNANYPRTTSSPQVTAFTLPVSHSSLGGKLVGNKIVIPLPPCGHLRTTSAGMALIPSDSSNFPSISGSQPSNIIIVKNGNNTQIIHTPQQPTSSRSFIASSKVTPVARSRNINPLVSKTVPKIIKQAAKKLTQPVVKRTIAKPSILSKTVNKDSLNLSIAKQPLSTYSAADSSTTSAPNNISIEPSPESLLVQRAIAEAKRAIAENNSERPLDLKSVPKEKLEVIIEKVDAPKIDQSDNKDIAKDSLEIQEIPVTTPESPKSNDVSVKIEEKTLISDEPLSLEVERKTEMPVPSEEIDILESHKPDLSDKSNEPPTNEDASEIELKSVPQLPEEETPAVKLEIEPEKEEVPNSITESEVIPKITSPIPIETSENADSESKSSIVEKSPIKPLVEDKEVSEPVDSKPEISVCSTPVSPTTSDQPKELQPIDASSTASEGKNSDKTLNLHKGDSRTSLPEGATRSFTSISDAVRFSLMDMDDATDSVENQVLQAFQVSHDSSPNSPAYDNNSTNEGDASETSPSSVILTTPQNTTTTELNVSRVSQRFEASVHSAESEKFAECQSTVSRTTTWILEDTSLNESSQVMQVQKSPELDSSGEGKEDEKPKKKRKRKDRCERDLEALHKFWCEICHKGFFSAYNLRRHCRNVHKMNLPRGSSELPFGPKSTSEISFASSSQCHQQVQQNESSASEATTPPRLNYVQQTCISPKGTEFMLQSPTRENKTQDFSMKTSTNQHSSQLQSSDFQMQTPPRISNPSSSSHVSPITPPKDFRLPNVTTASTQLSPNKMSSVAKPATSPKFQRLPTCSTPTAPQLPKMPQIPLCGQPALQQQRQVAQIQSSPLVQPLASGACQAQQLQAAQCSHFQTNKQIVQQRIGQLQLMHHAGQMPQVQHSPHGIPKQAQIQQYKKNTNAQQSTKLTETEQIQQAAQLAQTQQILTNQHLQKLMHIRQNAIVASGAASQLSLGTSLPGIQSPPSKSTAQCFQSQLAAARQAATVTQLPTQQRNQGTGYALASHDSSLHQFFPPSVQSGQEQSSCPHSFTAQNVVEFSGSGPSYPTIRLSSETNDGLEDLEQFLLENMPWSGDQSVSHALNQQSGNRPSSADSLTLAIPSQSSISVQNRTGTQSKNKTSITRPKPRKPVVTSCSKNLLGNLGRGVKKKSSPKKVTKNVETESSKSEVFSQNNLINQQAHGLDLMQRQCNKGTSSDIYSSKSPSKSAAASSINENDSSDSIQCINVTHNPNSKNVSVGINFNTFSSAEKNMNTLCNTDPNSRLMFGIQNKNPFLDQCNLVNKNCSNLGDNKSSNLCDNSLHTGSPFAIPSKDTACDPKTTFFGNSGGMSMCSKRSEAVQDIFLGQRNSERCNSSVQDKGIFGVEDSSIANFDQKLNICCDKKIGECGSATESSKSCSVSSMQNLFLGEKTASSNSAVSVNVENKSSVNTDKSALDKESNGKNSVDIVNCTSAITETNTLIMKKEIKEKSYEEVVCVNTACDINCMKLTSSETSEQINGIIDNTTENKDSETQKDTKPTTSDLLVNTKGKDINFNNVIDSNNFDSSLQNLNSKGIISNENSEDKNIKDVSSENNEFNIKIGKVEEISTFCFDDKKSDYICDSVNTEKCDEKHIVPMNDKHDQHSSQENKVPNGMNHTSDLNYSTENGEVRSKYIALGIHKSEEYPNIVNDDQFYNNEKCLDIVQVEKKNLNKKLKSKKSKAVNYEKIDKESPVKLDINSNIQNTNLPDKQNEVNGQNCENADYYPETEDANHNSEETQENHLICISDKQKHLNSEEIPTGRLRLRGTPKTSVKRVCPCCVDSRMPKKCRANGGSIIKLFGPKVPNSNKGKATLKAKNATNTKVNTRSSQRLRSRNNAVS